MAHKKAGGSTKNNRDSNPQYLGLKLHDGQQAQPGSILVRQRGNKFVAGDNVMQGKDYTLFSTTNGTVKYSKKRKTTFTGKAKLISIIDIHPPKPKIKQIKKTE